MIATVGRLVTPWSRPAQYTVIGRIPMLGTPLSGAWILAVSCLPAITFSMVAAPSRGDRSFDRYELDDGRTNAEIATELSIAPRTASAHVEHILAKLGVGRRTEIATWVATVMRAEAGAPATRPSQIATR